MITFQFRNILSGDSKSMGYRRHVIIWEDVNKQEQVCMQWLAVIRVSDCIACQCCVSERLWKSLRLVVYTTNTTTNLQQHVVRPQVGKFQQ